MCGLMQEVVWVVAWSQSTQNYNPGTEGSISATGSAKEREGGRWRRHSNFLLLARRALLSPTNVIVSRQCKQKKSFFPSLLLLKLHLLCHLIILVTHPCLRPGSRRRIRRPPLKGLPCLVNLDLIGFIGDTPSTQAVEVTQPSIWSLLRPTPQLALQRPPCDAD